MAMATTARTLQIRTSSYEVYLRRIQVYELCVLNGHTYQIYQSIRSITSNLFYDEDTDSILFVAQKVVSLSKQLQANKCLTVESATNLLEGIGNQMAALRKQLFGFVGFDVADIVAIVLPMNPKPCYICAGTKYLCPMTEDGNSLEIQTLDHIPQFRADADWLRIQTLPYAMSWEQTMEALGLLMVAGMYGPQTQTLLEWVRHPQNPLRHTKLHGCLMRCAMRRVHLLYL
jgi:hypothetical protein